MNWLDNLFSKKNGEYKYIYPYSEDFSLRRIQLIQNLEKGILFEDLNFFVEWNERFKNLQSHYHKKQKNKTYRDNGRHVIIDGLQIGLDPEERLTNSSLFIMIESFLGFDDEGHNRYLQIKSHLSERFGMPTKSHNNLPYDFYGDTSDYWIYDKFEISLSVWERFAVHYALRIRTS